MAKTPAGGQDELSAGLLALRIAAKLSQPAAGALTSASASKVSRVEHGLTIPTPAFVAALCKAYGASGDDRRRLVALAEDVKASTRRVVMRRGVASFQRQIGRVEQQSALIRSFGVVGVPGLLQTPDYMRALFHGGDDLDEVAAEEGVQARLANQRLLDDPDSPRQFVMIMTEGGLGWSLGSHSIMADQMDHIAASTRRRNVRIGIIPWGTSSDTLPLHSWELYDSRHVIAGTTTATASLNDPREVARYEALFVEMEKLAVFGDEARAVLARVAGEYRAVSGG